jgi:SAM-dependent methyltransferase
MNDLIGQALLDYQNNNYTDDLYTETNISEVDILPLPYLFRSFNAMPPLEKLALKTTVGKVLDVGCGAGSLSLYLQESGNEVTGIDISVGAIKVCKLRGLTKVKAIDILRLNEEKFDTILLLMNGTGIFQKLDYVSNYLQHLKKLLAKNGQILIDSTDLRYMYDKGDKEGSILVPAGNYYGELEFTIHYKNFRSEPFDWLYLDPKTFKELANKNGLSFEVIGTGKNYDYLAKLTII